MRNEGELVSLCAGSEVTMAGVGSEMKELSAAAPPTAVEADRSSRVALREAKFEHAVGKRRRREITTLLQVVAPRGEPVEDGRRTHVEKKGDRPDRGCTRLGGITCSEQLAK